MTAPQDRQPATAVGRRLLALTRDQEWFRPARDEGSVAEQIVLIEREARAQLIAELREGVGRALTTFETERRERYIHIGPVRTQASIDAPVVEVWADPQLEVADFTAAVLALIEKAAGDG